MTQTSRTYFESSIPWLLVVAVCALAVVGWGSTYGWTLAHLSPYQVFPLFGLLAYSIMWTHYVIGALMKGPLAAYEYRSYFRVTEYLVLVAIVLHPTILIYQRFRDGYGLPPGSYISYVAPSLEWVVLLGTASFLVFMTYELHRWFEDRPWWKYVKYANEAAMLAIFYHSLRLGTSLGPGWFRMVWYLYGGTLIGLFAYKYVTRTVDRITARA